MIVGGGYVGLFTAMKLRKLLRRGEATLTIIDPRSYMTYQPFLPEAAAGSIQPRHTVVPLRPTLKNAEVITGWVRRVRHADKVVVVEPLEGDAYELPYDIVVMAVGSISRTLPIPGLAEWGTGFKNVEEAIQLRNRVIECLDIAESTRDEAIRQRNLTFVGVGAGFAGVEALAELEDMSRYATRFYRHIDARDLRWVLVEASDHILPEVGPKLGVYVLDQLRSRGIDVRLNTRLVSCVGGRIVLSDGTEFDSDTLMWTAGVKAHPMLGSTDLPIDEQGRLRCRTDLRVEGVDSAWGAGDACAVPDLTQPGEYCLPTAQHAVRQATVLAKNIVKSLRGKETKEYRHKNAGSVAALGLHKGAAQVFGFRLRGFPAWFMHRTYHMSRVPTLQRKVAVVTDWTLAFFFSRDITSLWGMHEPFRAFESAARGDEEVAS